MSIFHVVVMAVLLGDVLWWGWAHHRLRLVPKKWLWQTLVALFIASQLAYILYLLLDRESARNTETLLPRGVVAVVYLWHIVVMPITLVTLLLAGLARTGLWLMALVLRRWRDEQASDSQSAVDARDAALTRRQVLSAAAVSLPPFVALGAAARGMMQLGNLRVRHMHLSFAALPPAMEELTIAHISDLHVGRWTRGEALRTVVETSNRLKPDLVLLPGDLIDMSLDDLPRALEAVRQLESRYGVYLCEGNHDLIDSRVGFETGVKNSGIPLLIDETMLIDVRGEPLQLLGLRWGRGESAIVQSTERLAQLMRYDAFSILLAHHPHAFDHTTAHLTLAGHTHGGQLMLNERLGAGPVMFRYWSGLYQRGARSLLVSNGAGNWFPLRVNAPAEIVHITLHRGTSPEAEAGVSRAE